MIDFNHQSIKETNRKEIVIAELALEDGKKRFGVYSVDGKVLSKFNYIDCNENLHYDLNFKYDFSCTCEDGSEKLFDSGGKLLKSLPGKVFWRLSSEFYRITSTVDRITTHYGVVDKDLNVVIEPSATQIVWVYEDRYFCLSENKDTYNIVKLYDLIDQDIIYETKGVFRMPNSEGIVKHEKFSPEGKRMVEELNLKELIKK